MTSQVMFKRHFVIFDSFDIELFEYKINDAYNNYKKVIFIFDFSGKDFGLIDLIKGAPILEKYRHQTREKLDKSIIIAPKTWQKVFLKSFFLIVKPERPYEFYDSISYENYLP